MTGWHSKALLGVDYGVQAWGWGWAGIACGLSGQGITNAAMEAQLLGHMGNLDRTMVVHPPAVCLRVVSVN